MINRPPFSEYAWPFPTHAFIKEAVLNLRQSLNNIYNQIPLPIVQYQNIPKIMLPDLCYILPLQHPTQIPQIFYLQSEFGSNWVFYQQPNIPHSNSEETVLLNSPITIQNAVQTPLLHEFKTNSLKDQYFSNNEVSDMEADPKSQQIKAVKQKWKQKFGRNIKSNIFVSMVKFMQRLKVLKTYVRKIIQKHNLTLKHNEFYNKLKKKVGKLKAYVTQSEISNFFNGGVTENSTNLKSDKQRQWRKVFRIISRIYLSNYHIPYVFTTNKIKKNSKKLHLVYLRENLRQ